MVVAPLTFDLIAVVSLPMSPWHSPVAHSAHSYLYSSILWGNLLVLLVLRNAASTATSALFGILIALLVTEGTICFMPSELLVNS